MAKGQPRASKDPLSGSPVKTRATTRRSLKPSTTFLDLPLEIRDMIYRILLVQGDGLRPEMSYCPQSEMAIGSLQDAKKRDMEGLQPQILRVNKQTHEEGTRLLYGYNTFRFCDHIYHCPSYNEFMDHHDPEELEAPEVHDLRLFLIDIGVRNRALLRKLEFTFTRRTTFGPEPQLRSAVKGMRWGGKSFVDGFRMLATGHSLQSIRVNLEGCDVDYHIETREALLQGLAQICNVPDLVIERSCFCTDCTHGPTGTIETYVKSYWKAQQENEKKPKSNPTVHEHASTDQRAARKKEDQLSQKILKIVEEKRFLELRMANDKERCEHLAKKLKKVDQIASD